MSSFCISKSYSHFFSKNICELDIVLTRTVNILTTSELVKANDALNNWALNFENLMRPNWPKLACLTQKTWHCSCFRFCDGVHYSIGSFLLESIYVLTASNIHSALLLFPYNIRNCRRQPNRHLWLHSLFRWTQQLDISWNRATNIQNIYMGCVKRKSAFEHAQNLQIHIILHMHIVSFVLRFYGPDNPMGSCRVRSNPGISVHWNILQYPMIPLADERPWDIADAQADLGLRCSYLPEDMFSHGVAHIGNEP